MATRLCVLVIGVIAIGACVSLRPDEPALAIGDAGSNRSVRSSSKPVLPSLPLDVLMDAGGVRDAPAASELDAQTDSDAGLAELAEDIALDCRETLRCDPRGSLPSCIASVTEALAEAGPEARARFRAIVMPCRGLRACEYVSCVQRATPATP